jgi:vacuolar-type H+-ATPase subunit H
VSPEDFPYDYDVEPAGRDGGSYEDEAPLEYEEFDELEEPTSRRRLGARNARQPDAEELLRRVADLIASARPMPLSASAMINKEEVLELVEEAIERLPEELRDARWLRKERDEFLEKTRLDGDEILDAARARAERMVQRTEVVKAAEHRARRIIEGAEAEARRLRHEVEDFCDQKLASFEIVLERTLKLVGAGREKLQITPTRSEPVPYEQAEPDPDRP